MNKYTIKEVVLITELTQDTLRYYDSLNIIKPTRGENKYRYYSDNDIMKIKYLKVMKYAGFSLEEVKVIFQNFGISDIKHCNGQTIPLLENKKKETKNKIDDLSKILKLIDLAEITFKKKITTSIDVMDQLVLEIYQSMEEKV